MAWKKWYGTRGIHGGASVSIYQNGNISFNVAAIKQYGLVAGSLDLYYDDEHGLIGFAFAEGGSHRAWYTSKGRALLMRGAEFLQAIGWNGTPGRFAVYEQQGMVVACVADVLKKGGDA